MNATHLAAVDLDAMDEDNLYEHLDAQPYWDDDDGDDGDATMLSQGSCSPLLTLVQSYDWLGTLARIASAPHEARTVGYQRRSPLHVACDNDAPGVVIHALLRAYPEASTKVGTTMMNPLHITCSSPRASVEVVRVLLEGGDPIQTTMRDVDGDTPLHTACRCGAPIEVLEILLRANPAAVSQRDYEGLTPLLRLWVRYFVMLGDDAIENVQRANDVQGELKEAWQKTELLLQCAHHGSLPPLRTSERDGLEFRVLHAVADVDCPRAVVKIATILYYDQLQERDEEGMTPLLLACKAPIFKVRDLSDKGYLLEDRIHGDSTVNSNNYNYDILSAVSPKDETTTATSQPSVIDILLQAPRHQKQSSNIACIPSPCGRLPLNWALVSGKKWNEGIKALVQANPNALGMADLESGLYPFMLAASSAASAAEKGSAVECTNTIFELLRLDPSLVSVAE